MRYTKEYLESIVSDCKNTREVLIKLGCKNQGGNYRYVRNKFKEFNINISHFSKSKRSGKRIDLKDQLIKGKECTINGNLLKSKLYKEGLKQRKCELCDQGEEWKGKKISLILDHVDGDRNNNLLENLRIVCPNCNATLDTHCGKNKNRGVD